MNTGGADELRFFDEREAAQTALGRFGEIVACGNRVTHGLRSGIKLRHVEAASNAALEGRSRMRAGGLGHLARAQGPVLWLP